MIRRLLLVGFILLLVVLIIWMLFKINSQSRQISKLQSNIQIRNNIQDNTQDNTQGNTQGNTKNDDHTTMHTRANPVSFAGGFVVARVGENLVGRVDRDITDDPNIQLGHGEQYYETIQHNNHANDTQNVHDSMVIKELKKRYDRLIELNQSALIVPADIADHINQDDYADMFCQTMFIELGNYCQTYFDPINFSEKFQKAQKVIETARQGSIFTGFIDEIKEDWILAHVWYRIHSSDNTANRDQLLSALMDQLQDAGKYALAGGIAAVVAAVITGIPPVRSQELTTECTTGRIGRYFQTFTLLDADPLLQQPILDEKEYENEAYAKSYKILTKFIDNTPGMNVLYHTADEDTLTSDDRTKLNEMRDGARAAIAEALVKDYEGIIPQDKLDRLIEKCAAGA